MKGPKPLKLSREIREQMRRNAESLMVETLALFRPDGPPRVPPDVPPRVPPKSKRTVPKPRKRIGATPRR